MKKFYEEFPFPTKAMLLVGELSTSRRISEEETDILNDALLNYMDLRCIQTEKE